MPSWDAETNRAVSADHRMRRRRSSVAGFRVAALAAPALSGCGSDEPSGDGPQGGPPKNAGSKVSAASSSAEQAAFAAMLAKVAQPCSSTDGAASGPTGKNASGPTGKKPTGPDGEQSLPSGEPPPTDPIGPGAPTGPEAELNDRDRCAGVQHEQRIVQALQAVSEPTPAKVRKALDSLGYIDERIHGLKQDSEATRFHLDLRESGGRLREAGLAADEAADMTLCTAPRHRSVHGH
ncbi:hypothetical protein [Streptomyces rhizosphaerihabitans]|uniref:hypothetical protein n=1 Tax=Streptomyces rhizosphaerihabitans TaxID=1266770 RepID=UPI0021BF20BF|nr:hypothetical protein [Streptomyces rhizosphaerihabitans]MCT9008044.1 hypothetical protein [Streptomyces rhizosphaerihabitans]